MLRPEIDRLMFDLRKLSFSSPANNKQARYCVDCRKTTLTAKGEDGLYRCYRHFVAPRQMKLEV